MLAYVEIVTGTLYFIKKINILYESKERHAKTKLMKAKLRAVSANFECPQFF